MTFWMCVGIVANTRQEHHCKSSLWLEDEIPVSVVLS